MDRETPDWSRYCVRVARSQCEYWQHVATRLAKLRTWTPRGSAARVLLYAWRESLGVAKFRPLDSDSVRPITTDYAAAGKRIRQPRTYSGRDCGDGDGG